MKVTINATVKSCTDDQPLGLVRRKSYRVELEREDGRTTWIDTTAPVEKNAPVKITVSLPERRRGR